MDKIPHTIPSDNIKKKYNDNVKNLLSENEKLKDALIQCVLVLKQWHGVEAFEIYYKHSPEMQKIRNILPYNLIR